MPKQIAGSFIFQSYRTSDSRSHLFAVLMLVAICFQFSSARAQQSGVPLREDTAEKSKPSEKVQPISYDCRRRGESCG